jgi:hypothetical protein
LRKLGDQGKGNCLEDSERRDMMGGRTGVEHCSSNLEYKIKKYFKNYSTLSLVYSDNRIIYHENAQENLNLFDT